LAIQNQENPLLYTNFRKGNSDDPYVYKYEQLQVHNNEIRLSEIPQLQYRTWITCNDQSLWYEVDNTPSENQYQVDYNNGRIFFHPSAEGIILNIAYLAVGQMDISADRVYMSLDDSGISETLTDVVNQNRINGNLTHQLSPVNTFADIATTYPLPINGDIVQTINDGKVYMWKQNVWSLIRYYPIKDIIEEQLFSFVPLKISELEGYNLKISDLIGMKTNIQKMKFVNFGG
jgi:hypothetical protein